MKDKATTKVQIVFDAAAKATTKVRIVFDTAAKASEICLNDAIYQVPKLYAVLTHFRPMFHLWIN